MSDFSSEKIFILPGKYVIAVSGGVDSTVLLDLLRKHPDIELIVAHFNHGIRSESNIDEKFVRDLAKRFKLDFEAGYDMLGSDASEEKARDARYKFLHKVRNNHKAKAVITAHHKDDLIETAVLNLLRGSNHKGLSAMVNNKKVIRPLITIPKADILAYAIKNNLKWIEDTSNSDIRYLRNYVRKLLQTSNKGLVKQELYERIDKVAKTQKEVDDRIATISQKVRNNTQINRSLYSNLPPIIAKELLAFWLRDLSIKDFDNRTIERLYVKLKTAPLNTKHEVGRDWWLITDKNKAYFSNNRVGRLI